MSALESALDILSRAATMVQEEGPKSTELDRLPNSATNRMEPEMEPEMESTVEPKLEPVQEEALDMSKGKKGPPTFRRPGIITGPKRQSMFYWNQVDDRRRTRNLFDPAVDEHFKRSLGPKRYAAVFNPTGQKEVKEASSSVDDHFAKSLGDQWKTLKQPCSRRTLITPIPVAKSNNYNFPTLKLVCSVCGQTDH